MKSYILTRFFHYLKASGIKEARALNVNAALTLLWGASTLAWESKVDFFHDKEIDHSLYNLGQAIYEETEIFPKHKKIRIGYITSGILSFGGLTQHIENIIKFHNRDEFEIYIYSTECSFDSPSHKQAQNRIEILKGLSDKFYINKYDISFFDKANSIIKQIKKDEIDVFAYFLAPNDVVAQLIVSCTSNYKNIYFHDSSHLFCLGSYQYDIHIDITKKYLARCINENINKNTVHIPLPGRKEACETPKNKIRPIRTKYNLSSKDLLTITVGNPTKNIWNNNFDYIYIIGELLSKNANVYHVLVADGMEKIKGLITKKYPSVKERIIVEKSTTRLLDLLQDCDLYLSSYPLGGGLAILDAIAAKLPAVSIELQREILLCDEIIALNKEEYISISQRLISDSGLRRKISKRLFELYEKFYNPKIIANEIEDIYRNSYRKNVYIHQTATKVKLGTWRTHRFNIIFHKIKENSVNSIRLKIYKFIFCLVFR